MNKTSKSKNELTSTDKSKTNKSNNNNNNNNNKDYTNKDNNSLQIRVSLDLNIRNYKILHHFKTLNLNLRVTVNDLRLFKESLVTTVVKHKVDYKFRKT